MRCCLDMLTGLGEGSVCCCSDMLTLIPVIACLWVEKISRLSDRSSNIPDEGYHRMIAQYQNIALGW